MPDIATIASIGLLLTLGLGMVRVIAGPTRGDRLMSLLLVNTTGIALLLVLNDGAADAPGLIDAALALSVLGPVATVAFLVAARRRSDAEQGDAHGE